ncbi:MAG: alpha/beta hydrolase [Rhizobiaceae bacterium]|nr:alpha/beta hydrolase [Rhizobiaceae bacterium]
MPEVIFNGPSGRLEGRYQPSPDRTAPIALILHPHPHPKFGGTMDNKVVYDLFYMFVERGFTTLRFNFRGVGRSQGEFDHGLGELSDAAAALDWVQSLHPDSRGCWIAGFSFGSWIGMQLLMRRPEIEGFMSIAPQPNIYDFSFLAPCPSSGLIIHGSEDKVSPPDDVQELVDKLKAQRGILITQNTMEDANHFFTEHSEELIEECSTYLDKRLGLIEGGVEETMLLR